MKLILIDSRLCKIPGLLPFCTLLSKYFINEKIKFLCWKNCFAINRTHTKIDLMVHKSSKHISMID
jgi:hypothetical protein